MLRFTASTTAVLVAGLLCAACALGAGHAPIPTQPLAARSAPAPGTAACYAFAVSALRRHVIVRRTPPECARLGAEQVDQAVSRAIHTVVGPLAKAAARRQDQAESRYLASLIRRVRPAPPASLAAGRAETSGTLVARLAALAAWLAAALAGSYLLTGGRRPRLRQLRGLGIAGGHAAVAATGLCLWVGFMVTGAAALGWIDAVLTWVIAGLGMATLLGGLPADPAEPAELAEPAGPAPGPGPATVMAVSLPPAASVSARAPVLVIALHGALAAVTILLVLLAVIGTG
jgi:hypothetical protein